MRTIVDEALERLNQSLPKPETYFQKLRAFWDETRPEIQKLSPIPVPSVLILKRIREIAISEFGRKTPLGAILSNYGRERLLNAYQLLLERYFGEPDEREGRIGGFFNEIAIAVIRDGVAETITDSEIIQRLEYTSFTGLVPSDEDLKPECFSVEEVAYCRQVIADRWARHLATAEQRAKDQLIAEAELAAWEKDNPPPATNNIMTRVRYYKARASASQERIILKDWLESAKPGDYQRILAEVAAGPKPAPRRHSSLTMEERTAKMWADIQKLQGKPTLKLPDTKWRKA